MTERVFLSDFHVQMVSDADPVPLGGHPYHWLSEVDKERVCGFLAFLEPTSCSELILLGDVFDTWMVPHDVMPLEAAEMAQLPANRALMERLRAFGNRAIFVPGNHDMLVSAEELRAIFPDMRHAGPGPTCPVFACGRLRAEHGNAHALFNAPDPLRRHQLPLGYFLSRLATTAVRRNGKRIRSPLTLLDDLLELVGPARLAEAVLDATMEEAGLRPSSLIQMPQSLYGGEALAIGEISILYKNLYAEWCERKGPGTAFKAIWAELGHLGDAADRLCKRGGTNIVLFGHSHAPEVDKDSAFVDDRIYANTGAVCGGKLTYVRTDKDVRSSATVVSLCEWDSLTGERLVTEKTT